MSRTVATKPTTDRALTWDQWRSAVWDAYRDRILVLAAEIDNASAPLHPAADATLRWWICDVKEAIARGDVTAVEQRCRAIREKLDLERRWARDDAGIQRRSAP